MFPSQTIYYLGQAIYYLGEVENTTPTWTDGCLEEELLFLGLIAEADACP